MTIDIGQIITRLFEISPFVGLLGWLLLQERKRTNQLLDKVLELAEKQNTTNEATRLALLTMAGKRGEEE